MRLFPTLSPPTPENDPVLREQAEWARSYQLKAGVPGEFVYQYARRMYDEAVEYFRVLDVKAGELLKTSGTLATILVAILGVFGDIASWVALPSLLCFLVSMVISAVSRSPVDRGAAPSIRSVLDKLPYEDGEHEARIAVSFHQAVEELLSPARWKAKTINLASWWLCAGVAWLLLPLIVWSIWGR